MNHRNEATREIDMTSVLHIYGQRNIKGNIQHLVLWDDDTVEWIPSKRISL